MNPKLQSYRNKIHELEHKLPEVEQPYKEKRLKFERILNLKGIELIQEWGICGDDIKLVRKAKAKIDEDINPLEETKIRELDYDQHDRSFLNGSVRKRPTTATKSHSKTTKHKITKSGKIPQPSVISHYHKVGLEEIGPIDPPEQAEPSLEVSASTERINKIIEKRHLHKPYKTSATIPEHEEYQTPVKSPSKASSEDKSVLEKTATSPEIKPEAPKLTSDRLRTSQLGSKRIGLGSSLINFAMEDVTRVNQVKSVYNQNTNTSNIGSMMNAMNISNTLSGMLMMNNGLTGANQSQMPNINDDNCSLISGNTMQTFQNIANPLFSMSARINNE